MDDDYICIEPGDTFTVQEDRDGFPAVRIVNEVFAEGPRWLLFQHPDRERDARIDALIDALTELRGNRGA